MKRIIQSLSIILLIVAIVVGLNINNGINDQRAREEKDRKFKADCAYYDNLNACTIAFCQDDKAHRNISECDMSRPIFIYDNYDGSLVGVLPGNKKNFIAERKAIPANL